MRDSKWKYCSKEHSHNKIEFRNGIRGKNRPRSNLEQCDLGELDERLKMEILHQGAQPQ